MIKTYLNGQVCGITQYDKDNDDMIHNPMDPAYIIFDSTAGIVDIYNIRVYKNAALSSNIVLNNYIATLSTLEEKTTKFTDNTNVLDDDNNISIEKIETENNNSGF